MAHESLWQKIKDGLPEGAATALGASFVFGPLAGLGVGLAQGVLAHRLRKSEREEQAHEAATIEELNTQIAEQLGSVGQFADTDIDQAQLANMDKRRRNLVTLSQHPDPKVRAKAAQDLADLSSNVNAYLEDTETRRETTEDARKNRQRTIFEGMAKELRGRYESAVASRRELQSNASQIHELLNSPDFDPNKPLNRGRLIDLMKSSSRTILADPAGFGDALQRAGGSGSEIGTIIGLIGGAMKADEFKFSKKEWRAIASALYDAESKQFAGEMERIQQGVTDIELPANELGILPNDFALADYVTGRAEDFPRPYSAPAYPEFGGDTSEAPRTMTDNQGRTVPDTRPSTAMDQYMRRNWDWYREWRARQERENNGRPTN